MVESGRAHVDDPNVGALELAVLFALSAGILATVARVEEENIFRLQVCVSQAIVMHVFHRPAELQGYTYDHLIMFDRKNP